MASSGALRGGRRLTMNYSAAEVARMVGSYESIGQVADTDRQGLKFLILLADLQGALDKLDQRGWEVMLLVGLLGIPQVKVAKLLNTSPRNVSRWYADAVEDVIFYINGGI